jgi:hypothetical protein
VGCSIGSSAGLAPFKILSTWVAARRYESTRSGPKDEHALALANRGFVLESGRVVLSGTGQELLASARVREAYLGL